MREIKFRAWDKEQKVMFGVEGINFDHLQGLGTTEIIPNPDEVLLEGENFTLDEVELMQFTGLRDKNGKEIYEGDLARTAWGVGEVFWTHICSFQLKAKDGSTAPMGTWYQSDYEQTVEVIGNIYENPELLK